jgi:hypothetical protein
VPKLLKTPFLQAYGYKAAIDWIGPSAIVLFMTRDVMSMADFEAFASSLVGLPVSHIWQGDRTAIFLEFGVLTPSHRRRRDGTLSNPLGEFTLMLEWGWRIEGKRRIWCGSGSHTERRTRTFLRLENANVVAVSIMGRLPEINIALSNGLHLVSCMTAEGDPEWGLIKRQGVQTLSVGVLAGRLVLETISLEDRPPLA